LARKKFHGTEVTMANLSPPVKSRDTRWLVLGASGFIGRAVMTELRAIGHHVIGTSSSKREDSDRAALDIFDAQQLKTLLHRRQPTVVLNAIGHPPALAPAGLREFYTR